MGRGGGSIEDLWAFNTIEVAESIYKAKKPIVSAVGHEVDFLISDFVADKRAATPTQAAEILLPEKNILMKHLNEKMKYLNKNIESYIVRSKDIINNKKNCYIFKNFHQSIQEKNILILEKETKLIDALNRFIKEHKHKLELYTEKLSAVNPERILDKGYTITKLNGKNINKIERIDENAVIETTYKKGKILSIVKND